MPKRKRKMKLAIKLVILFLLIVIVECCVRVFVKMDKETNSEADAPKEIVEEVVEIPEDITISFTAIGDIMCHNSNYNDAYSNGVYDFSYVFADITEEIQSADIAVGNLETTFAGAARGYSNYPTFNTPEALATDLKEMGIDLLSTSNNHSLDKGYSGIESTISFLDAAGIAHTGTYTSPESQNTIIVQDVKGIKIAFLSLHF